MSNNIVPVQHRHRRRDFLTIGAAVTAAVAAGIKAPPSVAAIVDAVPAASPIGQLIAEYQAAADAHIEAMSSADGALYAAFPDPMTRPGEDEGRPADIERLYGEAERLYWVMNAAYDRVIATPCTSLNDCIAVLEWADGDADAVIDAVLPHLRRLAGAA